MNATRLASCDSDKKFEPDSDWRQKAVKDPMVKVQRGVKAKKIYRLADECTLNKV